MNNIRFNMLFASLALVCFANLKAMTKTMPKPSPQLAVDTSSYFDTLASSQPQSNIQAALHLDATQEKLPTALNISSPYKEQLEALYGQISNKEMAPWARFSAESIKKMQTEQEELQQEFLDLCSLDQEAWNILLKGYIKTADEDFVTREKQVLEENGAVDEQLIKMVENLCKGMGIDHKKISIFHDPSQKELVRISKSALIISEETLFTCIESDAQELIAPAFMHGLIKIMHEDDYIVSAMSTHMKQLISDNKIAQEQGEAFVKKYSAFLEKRLDMITTLSGMIEPIMMLLKYNFLTSESLIKERFEHLIGLHKRINAILNAKQTELYVDQLRKQCPPILGDLGLILMYVFSKKMF